MALPPTIDAWERIEGAPYPFGVTWIASQGAFNFALYSRYATGVTLVFYRAGAMETPVYEYRFSPRRNKTGRVWHCVLPLTSLHGASLYGYRVEGPWDPDSGHRFDQQKVLLDPFAHAVHFPPGYDRDCASVPGSTAGRAPLGVLPIPRPPFDWGDESRPRHTHDLIVYELHVKGFTARANSGVSPQARGCFAGLVEKIPYLLELGVTAVELMPVHQFDPQEGSYWGYMTLNFFAPHDGYAAGDGFEEFREMVRAFHDAGLEVWIDVVYNHTTEGDATGPTLSYRGVDNRSYYLLTPDRRGYVNDTGTGNTLRCGEPVVRSLVINSLMHWTQELRVDGFRFDLASILARRRDGTIDLSDPAIINEISALARQADVRVVAEAWDISSYLLGRSFPGFTWRQWNGKFRDDVRAFVKSDAGKVAALVQRLYGSDDLFPDSTYDGYRPFQSVNFVTAHDGFCLYDLVSYNRKHNEANGHDNTDGTDDNLSWNCGWEGDAGAPPEVLALRRRQVKNFCCLLMLANGTPLVVAGDEFMNTQRGNNNPYNQDNDTTWLDWNLRERNADVFRFFQRMIAFRKAHPSIARSHYWRDDVTWYGAGPRVDASFESRSLAYALRGASVGDDDLYVMINAWWEPLDFVVQEGTATSWKRVVDTSLPSPEDIADPGHEVPVQSLIYRVGPRSIVVLKG
jgi:glycogen operon protein